MNKIPTVEEFFKQKGTLIINNDGTYSNDTPVEYIIEFAKLHVQEALKEAKRKTNKKVDMRNYEDELYKDEILTRTIIKAYPLSNIK
jgi:hypothetical protein